LPGRKSYLSRVILRDETRAGGSGYGLAAIRTSKKKKALSIVHEQNKKVAIWG
jgi:hypothetical protein